MFDPEQATTDFLASAGESVVYESVRAGNVTTRVLVEKNATVLDESGLAVGRDLAILTPGAVDPHAEDYFTDGSGQRWRVVGIRSTTPQLVLDIVPSR